MRRLLVCLLCFLVATPGGAAHYYVRAAGSDAGGVSACNGLTDADCTGAGAPTACAELTACAFATPANAMTVFNCATPDTLTIRAGTYSGAVTTPDPCKAPSDASRAIIEGPHDDTAILSGADGIADTLTLANPGATSMNDTERNRFLTITGLKILCSDDRCIQATGTWEGVTINDNTFVHDGGGASNASGNGNVIGAASGAFNWGWRVTNNRATGTEGLTRAGLVGTDAVFIRYDTAGSCSACTLEKGLNLAGNTVTAFHGALFDGNASSGVIASNIVDTSTCRGDESALIQIYNTTGLCVYDNLGKNVKPDGSFGLRILQVRTTDESSGKMADALVFNNTFIGSSLTNNGTSVKIGFEINSVLDRASPKTVLANNILFQNWGRTGSTNPGDRAPIMIQDCSDNGVDILNNLLDNNAWPETGGTTPDDALHYGFGGYTEGFPSGCTVHSDSGNLWDTPPSLETTNWTPDSASDPECGAGTTTVTCPAQANQAAVTSKSWIGYAQGSCVVAVGTRKLPAIIISSLRTIGHFDEILHYEIPPGEAVAWEEP